VENDDTSSKNNLNPQDQLNYKNKAKNLEFVKNNSNIKIPYFKEIIYDDFENKMPQTKNDQLIGVRETFDGYNLISALHSFHSIKDENYKNVLPPLTLLSEQKLKELIEKLNKLKFNIEKNLAA